MQDLRGRRDGGETVSGDVTAYSVSSLVFAQINGGCRPTLLCERGKGKGTADPPGGASRPRPWRGGRLPPAPCRTRSSHSPKAILTRSGKNNGSQLAKRPSAFPSGKAEGASDTLNFTIPLFLRPTFIRRACPDFCKRNDPRLFHSEKPRARRTL